MKKTCAFGSLISFPCSYFSNWHLNCSVSWQLKLIELCMSAPEARMHTVFSSFVKCMPNLKLISISLWLSFLMHTKHWHCVQHFAGSRKNAVFIWFDLVWFSYSLTLWIMPAGKTPNHLSPDDATHTSRTVHYFKSHRSIHRKHWFHSTWHSCKLTIWTRRIIKMSHAIKSSINH